MLVRLFKLSRNRIQPIPLKRVRQRLVRGVVQVSLIVLGWNDQLGASKNHVGILEVIGLDDCVDCHVVFFGDRT